MTSSQIRIAHISDPHFGTTNPEKVSALRNILFALKPDLIAMTGDITQRARWAQFAEARIFCDQLSPLEIMAVPGNHDIPLFNLAARVFRPFFGFHRTFGFPMTMHQTLGAVEVLALNTTDPKRHIQGQLSEQDAGRLAIFPPEALVRVVMFHHPMDCAKPIDEKNLLKSASETLARLEENKVDLVLGGHIHDPLIRLSVVRYPQARRPLVISVAGTCLSSRTRSGAPNSFNLLDVQIDDAATVRLNTVRLDLSAQGKFLPVAESRFMRTGRDQWTGK